MSKPRLSLKKFFTLALNNLARHGEMEAQNLKCSVEADCAEACNLPEFKISSGKFYFGMLRLQMKGAVLREKKPVSEGADVRYTFYSITKHGRGLRISGAEEEMRSVLAVTPDGCWNPV